MLLSVSVYHVPLDHCNESCLSGLAAEGEFIVPGFAYLQNLARDCIVVTGLVSYHTLYQHMSGFSVHLQIQVLSICRQHQAT